MKLRLAQRMNYFGQLAILLLLGTCYSLEEAEDEIFLSARQAVTQSPGGFNFLDLFKNVMNSFTPAPTPAPVATPAPPAATPAPPPASSPFDFIGNMLKNLFGGGTPPPATNPAPAPATPAPATGGFDIFGLIKNFLPMLAGGTPAPPAKVPNSGNFLGKIVAHATSGILSPGNNLYETINTITSGYPKTLSGYVVPANPGGLLGLFGK